MGPSPDNPSRPGHVMWLTRFVESTQGFIFGVVVVLVLPIGPPCLAAWIPQGNPVAPAPQIQMRPRIVPDGTGGAIVTWVTAGQSLTMGAFAQRMTSQGGRASSWPSAGLLLDDGHFPEQGGTTQDGLGGAFVILGLWGELNVRHVYADGFVEQGGVYDGAHYTGRLTARGPGTAFLGWSWREHRLVAIRDGGFPADGWPDSGVALGGSREEYLGDLVSDLAGGAYLLTYARTPFGLPEQLNLYLYRADSTGLTPGWPDTGVVVCVARFGGMRYNEGFSLVPTDDGVIVAWEACADDDLENADIFVQRIAGNGAVAPGWPADGITLCSAPGQQLGTVAIADGTGGAIVMWQDKRSGHEWDLYAQRVLATGEIADGWLEDGSPVCTAAGNQYQATPVLDNLGGLVATWTDYRNRPEPSGADIYAQRLLLDGSIAPGWPANGSAVCAVEGPQYDSRSVLTGSGKVMVVWRDDRPYDVGHLLYATIISADGTVADPVLSPLSLSVPAPNPASGRVTIEFDLAVLGRAQVEILDLSGRVVRRLIDNEPVFAGRTVRIWDTTDDEGRSVPLGIYFVRVRAAGAESSQRIAVIR